MIRLWGGGWYETDYFYELCDRLGIMIWHDFPFANSLYPADFDFLSNIIEETRDNLRRIRNHPAVVFFNGNNEILQGWQ
jgi:beta-mannosidase